MIHPVYVTPHALERIHTHHPNAGPKGVRSMLAAADPVDAHEVAGLLHRRSPDPSDRYFLSRCRRGIFVVAPGIHSDGSGLALVTYLRLSPAQREGAVRLWGWSRHGEQMPYQTRESR